MNTWEVVVFVVYLAAMLGIGIFFFVKQKNGGEKQYFLGGRKMGPWVSALSAGASDMSAWVLMGLPTSIYALGMGQIWVPVGLAIGYALSWIIEAPRLRRFSIVANDSITIPQYLTNRFLSKSKVLQIICAAVFLFAYTIYSASSIKACGTLFNTVLGVEVKLAMLIAAVILVSYTFLGGFSAVSWTDFFQGLLVLGAMFIAPIFAATTLDSSSAAAVEGGFLNPMTGWQDIASGLGWGLGYFGMPHIIIRFMALRSQKDLKKSAAIGITWTVLIVFFAALIGIVGKMYLDASASAEIISGELVFIQMVRKIFKSLPLVSGILLSAILAASMSTADSQLLAASSAFSSDVYKPVFRKGKASDREMNWVGRIVVLVIAVIAFFVASSEGSASIMGLVSNAWGVFGAAFGPVILLSLFWKRFNFAGAIAGILCGAAVDICWLAFCSGTGLYEIIPGFAAGILGAVIVSLVTSKPSQEVEELFDKAVEYTEE